MTVEYELFMAAEEIYAYNPVQYLSVLSKSVHGQPYCPRGCKLN